LKNLISATVFLIFFGCSEAPEGGVPFILEGNSSTVVEDKIDDTIEDKIEDKVEDTIEENITILTEKLTLLSTSPIEIEVGSSSTISFSFENYKTTSTLSTSSFGAVSTTTPNCMTASSTRKICSTIATAKSSGSDTISISVSGTAIKLSVPVTIQAKEVIQNEVLSLSSSNKIALEVDKTSTISFLLQQYNSDTKLLTSSANGFATLSNPICSITSLTSKSCSSIVTAKSSGTDQLSIYVSGKESIKIGIEVEIEAIEEIIENNISDENLTSIVDENISSENNSSDENGSIIDINLSDENISYGNGELSLAFGDGQTSSITIKEGENLSVITVVEFPRSASETVEILTLSENIVKVIGSEIITSLSDNNHTFFKTKLEALRSGSEKITFRVKGTEVSISLLLKIDISLCGLSSSLYNTISAGTTKSEIIIGEKLGFFDVELIYPKLSTYSEIVAQNFTYILDNGDGKTEHSNSGTDSFAFMKFSEDLVGLEYKIKYRDGELSQLTCLEGIFPEGEILSIDEVVDGNITEEEAPIPPVN
jgi:hypothetical protein